MKFILVILASFLIFAFASLNQGVEIRSANGQIILQSSDIFYFKDGRYKWGDVAEFTPKGNSVIAYSKGWWGYQLATLDSNHIMDYPVSAWEVDTVTLSANSKSMPCILYREYPWSCWEAVTVKGDFILQNEDGVVKKPRLIIRKNRNDDFAVLDENKTSLFSLDSRVAFQRLSYREWMRD